MSGATKSSRNLNHYGAGDSHPEQGGRLGSKLVCLSIRSFSRALLRFSCVKNLVSQPTESNKPPVGL